MRNLSGQKFGRLTAVKFIKKVGKKYYWLFKCDCGNEKIIDKRIIAPPSSTTKSCGCLARENAKKRFTENNPTKSHEMSGTRFHRIWNSMQGRCRNKNHSGYYKYGAKGIKICNSWLKFENFRDDMYKSYLKHCKEYGKKQTTIDRIDNKKGYSKKNCRWATIKEQANNKSNNRHFIYKGETMILRGWAEKYNIKYSTLRSRVYRSKLSIDKALKL